MKFLGRLLKWLLLSLLGIVLLVLLFLVLDRDAQHIMLSKTDRESIKVLKKYVRPADSSEYYSLLKTWGENKKLAPDFELQCLLALSHYPELKKVPIDFLVQPAFIQLSARPDPITVLLPWVKRKYLVVISNDTGRENDPILLSKAPFNEQVGIIGHELAHVVFYLDKNSLYLARLAYQYQYNEAFATVFEQETDKRAVAHGLGYQLYDFAFFVRKAFGNTLEEIEAEKGDMYLSPGEIAQEMKKYKFYTEPLNAPESYFEN
jgi:hypothetical protein